MNSIAQHAGTSTFIGDLSATCPPRAALRARLRRALQAPGLGLTRVVGEMSDGGPERDWSRAEFEASISVLRATLEATADGILAVDSTGRIVSYNRRFLEMWRLPEALVAGQDRRRVLEHVLPQLADPEGFRAAVEALFEDPNAEAFDVIQFADGRLFERHSKPHLVDGRAAGRVWSFRDVTERKELEAQLRHAQKMEAVGRLAGGVAHDFNNLLTAIIANVELARTQLSAASPVHEDLDEIKCAADRAAALTRQLLAFSRRQVLNPVVIDLNAVIADAEKLLRRVIGGNVTLVTNLDPGLGRARADAGQLDQVLVNLAVNARDAMAGGGTLTIETLNADVDAAGARRYQGLKPGPYAAVVVRDSGVGMDRATRARVFEPFFTTKAPGHGTGLGLSTVYGIVKQSGGYVYVESERGCGATFTIFLPRVPDGVSASAAPIAVGPTVRGRRETVLLVEDEGAVRASVRRMLERLGYVVLEAKHGADAMLVWADRGGAVDLVLTDVLMPEISGGELVERLRASRPEVRVLFMSGYAGGAAATRGILAAGDTVLEKPFAAEALAERVRGALDAEPA